MNKIKLILALAALGALAGCTTVGYVSPSGAKFNWRNVGSNKKFAELTYSTNGLHIKGYSSESTELIRAAAEGVAAGLGKAVVP